MERAVKAVMGARSECVFNNLREPLLWLRILDPVCSWLGFTGKPWSSEFHQLGLLAPRGAGTLQSKALSRQSKINFVFPPPCVFLLCILNQAVFSALWCGFLLFCCDLARIVRANSEGGKAGSLLSWCCSGEMNSGFGEGPWVPPG